MTKKVKRPRGKAQLLEGKCISCGGRCESSCPVACITMSDAGEPQINTAKCIGCKKCVKACPGEALEIFFTPEELAILKELGADTTVVEPTPEEKAIAERNAQYKNVWVLVEQTEGIVAEVSWELLGEGRKLANKRGSEVCALIIGAGVRNICADAFHYGADKCYLIDNPVFKEYRTEPYFRACCDMIHKHKPEIVLMGATGLGRDLAGAVATELQTGLTADCTELDIDPKGNLMQTRPAFGGNIMATIMCDKFRPQMSTVRPKVMQLAPISENPKSEIIEETVDIPATSIMTKVLEIIREKKGSSDIDISSTEFIVAGGRGMMSKENFSILNELADELGAVVAGSRMAVDAGWVSHTRQVGQTGKTVRPVVYIAVGISGAIQHMVGMQDSDMIIAVNKDKDAPIFEVANYGIVGDLFEVVPAMTKKIREAKASAQH
ncbi:FAD-binding protein [Desulfotalea psychrophila]|uniref:Electron transfer flavoprotein subunit alpha n=1 Tax=Desulfotalea psychrophila (strain LSv54 / DSM 12343) TaxID=177439 RepID=Q6AIQ0_DESPS|nr:FAD-binding protein [Desulfotalea psychrophila]CAG37780.1 probable electron transfer flavoprotein, alpha subunit [Desulfotalea psychrophila LSv54]